jgi:hypothetical protein
MCGLEYVVRFNGIGDLDWSKVELRMHVLCSRVVGRETNGSRCWGMI